MQQIELFILHGAKLPVQGLQYVSVHGGRGARPGGSGGAPSGGGEDH